MSSTLKLSSSTPPVIRDLVHFTQDKEFDSWNVTFKKYETEKLSDFEDYAIYFNKVIESLCSLGNGLLGQRGQMEETFSGTKLTGNYYTGCWYPDSTRVGWWKNGYPRYYPKMVNLPDWTGIKVFFDDKEELDLNNKELFTVEEFERVLHMKEAYLERKAKVSLKNKGSFVINSKRFVSMSHRQMGAIRYSLTSKDFKGKLTISPFIEGNVHNEEHNWEHDKYWLLRQSESINEETKESGFVTVRTKEVDLRYPKPTKYNEHTKSISVGMNTKLYINGKEVSPISIEKKEKFISNKYEIDVNPNDEIVLFKYGIVYAQNNQEGIEEKVSGILQQTPLDFDILFDSHIKAWEKIWNDLDIIIEGDVVAQQGARFCLFHVNSSCRYDMDNFEIKITPKGFTGEKYGTGDYWDVESFCVPYYLITHEKEYSRKHIARRFKHLPEAVENGKKLGFVKGAALYPMVSMGEECHNEWEITFEEIHRNGAIAKVIYDYVKYTNDKNFLVDNGLEILIALSKFWAQRVNKSFKNGKYMILGVTGPNEFENNVNNNWFTNKLASWTLGYTMESIEFVKKEYPEEFSRFEKLFSEEDIKQWKDISSNMYFPKDEKLGIWLQNDGFLDKELIKTSELGLSHRPLWRVWSWDRILRSCFIKQADTLQGLYYFEQDKEVLKKHFNFYEPYTVHESSLSACVHSILAAKLGMKEKAYELFLVALRYSLDNYNFDTVDGAHITSMAGALMMIVSGFSGLTPIGNGEYEINDPFLCDGWTKLQFKYLMKGEKYLYTLTKEGVKTQKLE